MRLGDFSRAIAEVEDAVEVYRSMDSPQDAWRYTIETQVWMRRYEKNAMEDEFWKWNRCFSGNSCMSTLSWFKAASNNDLIDS